ncbi:S8 family serine peptidase [Methylobacterium crusticola]|nr:S8 family serine peptidase [Methylobacterium crusticola]
MTFPEPPRPKPTGRFLVTFNRGMDFATARSAIENRTGIRAVDARDLGAGAVPAPDPAAPESSVVFDRFGVAVIEPQGDAGTRVGNLAAAEGVRTVRPEFYMFAIGELEQRYAAWVREGLAILVSGLPHGVGTMSAPMHATAAQAAPFANTSAFTWGLAAVGAVRSTLTGKGVRVAVLDTGLDTGHPDFVGRAIVSESFVAGVTVMDVQGHGTHTAGTIAGPVRSSLGLRYGVAPDCELYVGKVLDDGGSGTELDIIKGINWAIDQKCAVISMSLGRPTQPGEQPDPLYEEVGAAALREDCLIVAAAGNESARDFGFIAPVGAPANSPSIMAVAAVDPTLKVASFSCGGVNGTGGGVDLSGPGVSVLSSFPRPRLSRQLQGTSMACPHVAGVAALFASTDPGLRGQRLWDALVAAAREIGPQRDYGRGLVQAPPILEA